MADAGNDELREAARARGFRLVKSRRRKPGGDHGLYGLTKLATGRECFGFGADGLTATADEVRAYLRGGEVASWKRSLIGVVGEGEGEREKPNRRRDKPQYPAGPSAPAQEQSPRDKPPRSAVRKKQEAAAAPAPESAAAPAPALAIREAGRRDAAALARLIGMPASALADRLAAALRADEPPLVADRGGLIGVAAWTILPTLQHGPVGRVTLLLVAEEERRRGTGTALLHAVEQRLEEAGVPRAEMMLPIELEAPAGFLRRTGWARTGNGYGKEVGS